MALRTDVGPGSAGTFADVLNWQAAACAGLTDPHGTVRSEVSCVMPCASRLLLASACEMQEARRDCSRRCILTKWFLTLHVTRQSKSLLVRFRTSNQAGSSALHGHVTAGQEYDMGFVSSWQLSVYSIPTNLQTKQSALQPQQLLDQMRGQAGCVRTMLCRWKARLPH